LRTIDICKSTMQSRVDQTMVISIKWGMEEKGAFFVTPFSSLSHGKMEAIKCLVIMIWPMDNELFHVLNEIYVSANQTPVPSAWNDDTLAVHI
jgi:hypothetical protein